jgi:hypothetical protein
MRERKCVYRVFVRKPERRRPLGRPRSRRKDSIKWSIDWIDLAQDRNRWRALVNRVIILLVLQNEGGLLAR